MTNYHYKSENYDWINICKKYIIVKLTRLKSLWVSKAAQWIRFQDKNYLMIYNDFLVTNLIEVMTITKTNTSLLGCPQEETAQKQCNVYEIMLRKYMLKSIN